MKFGVVVFPDSNCGNDMIHVLRTVLKQEVVEVWHKDIELIGFETGDCVILTGGFSDRGSSQTENNREFSPIINAVIEFGNAGGCVFGVGKGFKVLCETGLLSGTLLENDPQKFSCKNVYLKTQTNLAIITSQVSLEKPLKIPIAHSEGRFFAEEEILEELVNKDQILFKYCDENGVVNNESNPNGSVMNIAGICNEKRNIFGMMPHPERASENILGNEDGRILFESLLIAARAELATA